MKKSIFTTKTRILAICLVVALLFSTMPLVVMGDDTQSSAEKYVATLGANIGDELINESFDFSFPRTNSAVTITGTKTEGWEFGDVSSGALWSAGRESAFSIGAGYGLNLFSYNDDGAVLLPALGTSDYIMTVKIKNGGNAGAAANIGILTDVNGSVKDGTATTSRRFTIVYNSATKPNTVSSIYTRIGTNNENNIAATLENTYTLEDFITVSVVSYDGTNYYFIGDDYITSQTKGEMNNERIGFVASAGDMYIDDVVVRAINTSVSEEEYAKNLGANIGEELINESFDFSFSRTNSAVTITGTKTDGWEFGDVSSGAFWSAGKESAFSIGSSYGLNLFSYNDDGVVLLPKLNTSDYIMTAKIKHGGGSPSSTAGILTDVDGEISAATTSRRFVLTWNTTNKNVTAMYTRLGTSNSNNVAAELAKTYNVADYVTITVVSYNGMNYYFVDGDYIMSQTKTGVSGERIGFVASQGDVLIDDVVVKTLYPSVPEEEYAKELGAKIGNELINESFDFSFPRTNSAVTITGTKTDGWEFGDVSSGALWSAGKESAFSIGANYGLNLFSYNDDGAILLPELGTSDYIMTAKIKNGGNAGTAAKIGILTDVNGSVKDGTATTSRRLCITYDSKNKPNTVSGIFTRVGTSNDNNVNVTLSGTYTLEDFITVSVVSYDGTNYYFIDGELITTQAKGTMTNERIGFVASVGDMYIDDVVVKGLIGSDIMLQINDAIEAEDIDVFKGLIKNKKAEIPYEIIMVDDEFMSMLKAEKTAKGANLTAKDIYTVSISRATDIGSRLELFVEDSLIDLNNSTASFVTMSPKFEEQVLNLSGGFVCDDIANGQYTGSFDASRITEDTRPWESLGSVFGNVITVNGKYYFYYRGVDDEVVGVDSYTGGGETDPLSKYLNVCVAVSDDGVNWTRPELDLFEFEYEGEKLLNNIVIGDIPENYNGRKLCSFSPFKDDSDPEKPFKAIMVLTKEISWWGSDILAFESADGIHWEVLNNGERVLTSNRDDNLDSLNVAFWCEEAQEYRLYFREWTESADYGRQRVVAMVSSKDLIHWEELDDAVFLDYYSDLTNEELINKNTAYDGNHPDEYQLYTNAIHTYDRAPHIYIGLPTRYLGTSGYEVAPYLIASRDGVNFKFWDTMLIEPSAELGRDGNRSNYALGDVFRTSETEYSFLATRNFKNSGCIIDRFSFRVDGFVAAVGDAEGKTVVTTPITFDGNRLLLNYKANGGSVRAQLTDVNGNVIEGFSFDDCTALTGDSIEEQLVWKGDLSTISQPVKIVFELKDAELYSYRFADEAGDVNKDGAVNIRDLVALNNMIDNGTVEATPVTDLNGDGKVDKLDLAEIRKIILA